MSTEFSDLIGKTVYEVHSGNISSLSTSTLSDDRFEGDVFVLNCMDGTQFVLYHAQDCCESVDLVDIDGDISDLIGSKLIVAEETTNSTTMSEHGDHSQTWTFYRFATEKGYVTLRWLGQSNGYYSERVDSKTSVKQSVYDGARILASQQLQDEIEAEISNYKTKPIRKI